MKYLNEYITLHEKNQDYGASSIQYFDEVCVIIDFLKPKTVLDYGMGKGALLKVLMRRYPDVKFYGYDPAIEGHDVLPIAKADLVINTDVLEHIPEEELPEVINQISKISQNAFFVLNHALAKTILPNGDNAHCTVKPPIWYYNLFSKFFKNPYPLKSRAIELSAMITFSPTVYFLRNYNKAINPPKKKTNPPQKVANPPQKEFLKQKILPYGLGKFITLFILKKENRLHFMKKHVKEAVSYKGTFIK